MDIEPERAAPVAQASPAPAVPARVIDDEAEAWPRWLPRLLGYFIAVGPAATDMYLPAFPAVEATFHTAPGTAQLTLAAWFAGLAVGQIMQGTLSDRLGRRRPLMIGFTVFALAMMGGAMAPNLTTLAALRFVGAIGASAGMVISRAVVRDLAEGTRGAILMSRLVLVMGVAPILAPSIGAAFLTFASWRFIFWFQALYGASCAVLAWRILPETLPDGPPHQGRRGADPGTLRLDPAGAGVPGARADGHARRRSACSPISAGRRRCSSRGSA